MNLADNIERVFNRAIDSDISTGSLWYRIAREKAHQIGRGDLYKGAGIIAALSPMIPWKENVRIASEGVENGGKFTGNYPANCNKAKRIFNGENPEKVLGGLKVTAFYHSIVTGGQTDKVSIDRHALGIALGRVATESERKRLSREKSYENVANAYRTVARRTGFLVSEIQAITWVTWRREKGITD